MKTEIKISAKSLAALNMPDACPRCFWIKNKVKVPFQIFPGIFSSLDSYQKKIVHAYIEKAGTAPHWMTGCKDVVGYQKAPHFTKFWRQDPVTGIIVNGVVDDILVEKSGAHIIPDYKTAKYTAGQDKLMPLYEAQLIFYRWIWEGAGNTVSKTILTYFEPMTDLDSEMLSRNWTNAGFMMDFAAKTVLIPSENSSELVYTTISKAHNILSLEEPPAGVDGCKDCAAVDAMMAVI